LDAKLESIRDNEWRLDNLAGFEERTQREAKTLREKVEWGK
jgi:hypothetical protein